MFKNYMKVAIRNLVRHKVISFINIFGLAIGMTTFILIILFVRNEFSYDKFHKNADRIYRITTDIPKENGVYETYPISSGKMGPVLVEQIPEIIKATRIFAYWKRTIQYEDKYFNEDEIFWVDPAFLEIFTFPLISGDSKNALNEPNSVILTQETAKKYFGDINPLNKRMIIENENFTVTGILKNIPANSHLHFDFLLPFAAFDINNVHQQGFSFYTYFLLEKNTKINEIKDKFQTVCQEVTEVFLSGFPVEMDVNFNSLYQALTDIHLYSHYNYELEINGNIIYVYIFIMIAVIIMIIAGINFMNLITAKSEDRANEISMRKIMGAKRNELIMQFLGESVLMSLIAFIVSLGMVELFINPFNNLMNCELSFFYRDNIILFCVIFIISIIIGILSGIYPAIFLSKFNSLKTIRGISQFGNRKSFLRKILVILQFSITIFLISIVFVINSQLTYLKNKNLGFDKEHIIVLKNFSRKIINNYNSVKDELLKNPDIRSVTGSQHIPGEFPSANIVSIEGQDMKTGITMNEFRIGFDFLKTYGIKIKYGRSFSEEISSDIKDAVIINETAAKKLGLESPLGKRLNISGFTYGEVIGVVEDFHFKSLHQNIEPLIIHLQNMWISNISIKIQTNDIQRTLNSIKKECIKFDPFYDLDYYFIDDKFDQMYKTEEQTAKLFVISSILAIFISMLGLFALSSFIITQRTKEIGIRKVMGAPVSNIIWLLSKEFTKWVILANLIAWPIGYFIMDKFLQMFAYKAEMNIWSFIISGLLALVIALVTVGYQTIKTANSNPVDALKYE